MKLRKHIPNAIVAIAIAAGVVGAQVGSPGLGIKKDATLQGTGSTSSPLGVNTTTLAGPGLTTSGAGLAVGCGTGLTCGADSISVSSSVPTTSGCSGGVIPVHSSSSALGCSQWTDDGTTATYAGASGISVPIIQSGLLDNLYLSTGNGVHNKSILLDSHTVISGNNSNDPSPQRRGALELFSGRDSTHALAAGQTLGDIAIQYGGSGGGFRHWISSMHSGAGASNNALRFWVNAGASAEDSTAPGTSNVNVLDLFGDGVGWFYGNLNVDGTLATSAITAVVSATLGATTIDGAATFSSTLTSTTAANTFGDLRGTAQVYTTPTGTQTITINASTSVLRFNAASQVDVIGLTGGADGRVLFIQNTGAGNVYFYEEHASATAANRIKIDANTGSALLVNSKGMAVAVYNGTASRWQIGMLPVFNYPTAVSFPGTVAIAQAATLTTTLAVNGNATLGDAVTDSHTANGDLAVTDDLTVTDVVTFNGSSTFGDANTDVNAFQGHVHTIGTDPTLSSCGTSPSIIGSDTAGTVTIGTGGTATACTITFANAYSTNAPACVITSQMSAHPFLYISSASTSAITVAHDGTALTASGKFNYVCIGVP